VHVTKILDRADNDFATDPTSPPSLAVTEARPHLDAEERKMALNALTEPDGDTEPQTRCPCTAPADGATGADTKPQNGVIPA
jgi:hypothetical protein